MKWYAYAFGFGFALFVGWLFIRLANETMWKSIEPYREKNQKQYKGLKWQPRVMGFIERTLYIIALLSNHGEFIAVWLGIKTAGGWERWKKADGRILFSISLFGSGLSLLYAAVGYQSIKWIEGSNWWPTISVPVLLVLGTVFLRWYIEKYRLAYSGPKQKPQNIVNRDCQNQSEQDPIQVAQMSEGRFTIDSLWNSLNEGDKYRTPDSIRGKEFFISRIDPLGIMIQPQRTYITKKAFKAAINYLRANCHHAGNKCEIRSNNDRNKAGPLCRASRDENNNVRCINYILPIFKAAGIVDVSGGRPNKVWLV